MAEEYPGRVRGAVVGLITLLDDTDDMPRGYAAWALRNVAEKFPGDVRGAVDDLANLLDDPHDQVRGVALATLRELAEEYPDDVRPVIDQLRDAREGYAPGTDEAALIDDVVEAVAIPKKAPPETLPAPVQEDIEFDDIETLELLGSGGDAKVYRSRVTSEIGLDMVAVKFPNWDGTLRVEDIENFVQGAETWSELADHDHIVTVIDWGRVPEPWLAMEYMDAGSLTAYTGEMDLAQALWTGWASSAGSVIPTSMGCPT